MLLTFKEIETKKQPHEDTKQIYTSAERIERAELKNNPSLPGEDS